MKNRVLIAGGSGLIGKRLADLCREAGKEVRILTRTPRLPHEFKWDPEKGEIDVRALEGVEAVVNLAGAGIADKRWTTSRKKQLIDSRVFPAKVLREAISQQSEKPGCYISAAAIGFYGDSGEAWMRESDGPASGGFMVQCCQAWESGADGFFDLGLRVVKLRIGIVLATGGGALKEVKRPLDFGLGVYFGSGKAWWSWIHLDDVCRMFLFAIDNQDITGTYNVVAPAPVRGRELVETLARALRRRVIPVPAPVFALKLVLGEMSAVLLNSNRVSAVKIQDAGFQFQYSELPKALESLYSGGKKQYPLRP